MQNYLTIKNIKIKKPAFASRIFDVDRGGVEPQKRTDEVAPETLRTRPSHPQRHINNSFIKHKELTHVSSLKPRTASFAATSSVVSIIHP